MFDILLYIFILTFDPTFFLPAVIFNVIIWKSRSHQLWTLVFLMALFFAFEFFIGSRNQAVTVFRFFAVFIVAVAVGGAFGFFRARRRVITEA
jgi:branched-subunit amino acid transport protein